MCATLTFFVFFFFNDTATTEIYTLSLHDALPISGASAAPTRSSSSTPIPMRTPLTSPHRTKATGTATRSRSTRRSEEHTSELQSPDHLVCRLLLEKKKTTTILRHHRSTTHTRTTS